MDQLAHQPRARLSVMTGTDGALCVRLGGELDIASVPDIEPELDGLLELEPQPAVLDLGELRFMDSSGIAVLIRLANHLGQVEMRNVAPAVRRVVAVLGLADRFGLTEAD